MKKICCMAVFLVAAYSGMAQVSAGSFMLGGSFEVESVKPEAGSASTYISVNPSAGYFLSENLAIGLNLGIGSSDVSSDFSVGPFVRYYKFLADNKFAIFGQGGVALGFGKDDVGAPPVEVKSSSFTLYASPGFAYFFNEKWVLDFQLSGISFRTSDPNKDSAAANDKTTRIVFGASSFAPSLGFRYIF